ncbi:MAG: endonuclease/exonuclease/phosphatase family protein [Gammaproteobacteria bacterium]
MLKKITYLTPFSAIDLLRLSLALPLLTLAACSSTPVIEQTNSFHETTMTDHIHNISNNHILTGPLKVLSLNIAHGRKDGFNQILISNKTIVNNLNDIASTLKQSDADIIALQEADGPSRWSGNINHVSELAKQADYPWHCRSGHARSWLFDYGTALLSQGYFVEAIGHSFEPTPPTTTKGFILGQLAWRPHENSQTTILIDIISVHLDFSRKKVRQQQITEIVEVLKNRHNPVILLGDFNSDWLAEDSVVAELSRRSRIHSYHPQAENLGTYKSGKRRLDWILISSDLEFKNYAVLPDILSDHNAVVAEIGLNGSAAPKSFEINKLTTRIKQCKGEVSCNTCKSLH